MAGHWEGGGRPRDPVPGQRPASTRPAPGQHPAACRPQPRGPPGYIPGYTFLTMLRGGHRAYCRVVTSADSLGAAALGCAPAGNLPPDTTATQRLISAAAAYGERPALIGLGQEPHYSFADLAGTVQRAAAGLAWRGLRQRDVVGVYVPDAACYALACHAVSAAGGVPSPVSPELTVPEIAGQLADCGARMLLTAHPLATAALAAADRSWVRQVIAFGDAPAATPFSSLLGMGSLRPPAARPHELAMLPYARQADGTLRASGLTHVAVKAELTALSASAGISPEDVVLAAPPTGDGRAYTAFLDHALLSGATVVATRPDEISAAASEHRGTAAIIALGAEVPGLGPLRLFAVPS